MLKTGLHGQIIIDSYARKMVKIYSIVLRLFLKLSREPASLTDWGRAFHSLGAEQENEPLYKDVRDLGTYREPLSDDLKFRECTCDIGFNKCVIYSGVRLFSAL